EGDLPRARSVLAEEGGFLADQAAHLLELLSDDVRATEASEFAEDLLRELCGALDFAVPAERTGLARGRIRDQALERVEHRTGPPAAPVLAVREDIDAGSALDLECLLCLAVRDLA